MFASSEKAIYVCAKEMSFASIAGEGPLEGRSFLGASQPPVMDLQFLHKKLSTKTLTIHFRFQALSRPFSDGVGFPVLKIQVLGGGSTYLLFSPRSLGK